jgi:hypothetical protein
MNIEISTIVVNVINAILMIALPTLVVAVIAAVVGWTRKEWALFKAAQPGLADQLAMYVKIAVEAAEQAGLAQLVSDKKAYALEIATRWLAQKRLNGIDVELIEAEIERQVREMNKPQLNDSPLDMG